jgi:hypothetical protein
MLVGSGALLDPLPQRKVLRMAATGLPMRRLRGLLRLKYDVGLSHRAIATV